MNNLRTILLLLALVLLPHLTSAQAINSDKTALTNFIMRMYKHATFEVKVVEDYEHHYLVSAVKLDPAKYDGNENTMMRVAGVKAVSQASRFLNGSNISEDLIVTTREDSEGNINTETIEKIKETSIGYVNELEHLSTFRNDEGKQVFLYVKQID